MRRLASALLSMLLVGTAPAATSATQSEAEAAFPWPPWPWLAEPAPVAETAPPRDTAIVVRRGPRSSGAVALTFDDGNDIEVCADIADALREQGAVGTFFINGYWLQQAPARWPAILEGMELGNHTRSHRDLTDEPHDVVIRQIRTNEYLHQQILGRPMLKVLRPPFGHYSTRVKRIAKQLGYDHLVMWSIDTGDWRAGTTAEEIVDRATGARPGSVILMHCGPKATARAVPEIVRHYQQRGIELAGLSTVLEGAQGGSGEQGGGGSERYGQ